MQFFEALADDENEGKALFQLHSARAAANRVRNNMPGGMP